jgi:putative NADH-flavin reductase
MKLAVLGATGKTGAHVVRLALEAGHEVVALARDPAAIPARDKLTVVKGDATVAADVAKVIAGTQAVVSVLGPRTRGKTNLREVSVRNIVDAMKQHGVKKVVWLSASGVGDSLDQAKRSSFVFGRIIIPLMLKATYADAANAEEGLRQSGLDFVIARPPGLTDGKARGDVKEIPLAEKLTRISIPRADVAAWMLEQAATTQHDRQVVTIC